MILTTMRLLSPRPTQGPPRAGLVAGGPGATLSRRIGPAGTGCLAEVECGCEGPRAALPCRWAQGCAAAHGRDPEGGDPAGVQDHARERGKFEKAWRLKIIESRSSGLGLQITNLARWFKMHVEGGTIGKRTTPRAILIPINTRLGARISAKKFYKLIDWLMREKLTVIRNGVLYVKPVMNTSRRGGVAVGTRVNKSFRAKFQGSLKRPSGFDIKLNAEGLTPIAIIRTSVAMKRRFNLDGIAQRRIMPVVAAAVTNRLANKDKRL